MRSIFFTVLAVLVSVSSARPEPALTASAADRLGAGFHAAPTGVACDAACASFAGGLSPLAFSEFGGGAKTALCSALRKDGTRAAGYQRLGGGGAGTAPSTTCTIVDGSASVEATDYACACVDPATQVQGLQRPKFGAACSTTCSTSLLGDSGRPVAVGAGAAAKGDHACLSLNEQGEGNRFGSEVAPGSCVGARDGGVAFGTDSFSCICVYEKKDASSLGAGGKRTFGEDLVAPAPSAATVSVMSTEAAAVDDP